MYPQACGRQGSSVSTSSEPRKSNVSSELPIRGMGSRGVVLRMFYQQHVGMYLGAGLPRRLLGLVHCPAFPWIEGTLLHVSYHPLTVRGKLARPQQGREVNRWRDHGWRLSEGRHICSIPGTDKIKHLWSDFAALGARIVIF